MTHLTDDQLQAYVTGELTDNIAEVKAHLRSCPKCQQQLAAYRMVFEGLADESGFMLSADFTDKVVKKAAATNALRDNIIEIGLLAAALAAAVFLVVYTFDLTHLLQEMVKESRTIFSATMKNLPFLSRENNLPILIALVILTLVTLGDRLLFPFKHR